MRTRWKRAASALAIGAMVAGLSTSPAMASSSGRTVLPGTLAPWAKLANRTGSVSKNEKVSFRVYLGWRNEQDLRSVIKAVSDPASPSYHHYLSAAQVHAAFSPTQAQVDRVVSWLQSKGFQTGAVPANHILVPATGTVGQAESAFGVSIQRFRAYGKSLRAPSTAVSIPSSLRDVVTGVVGLDDSYKLRHYNYVKEAPASPNVDLPLVFFNAPPCSKYYAQKIATDHPKAYGRSQPYVPCGLSPQQVTGAYGLTHAIQSGNDGTGETVAIIDAFASPTIVQDANTWSSRRGLPQPQIQQKVFPPNGPVDVGWYGEETLDVESVHGTAPGASILFVGAADAGAGIDDAQIWIVDHQASNIVSNSYGYLGEALPPSLINGEEMTFMQGAAEGIGFYFSSGDNGDETQVLGVRSVDWPASSDFVTAVGGTSLGVTKTNGYRFETGWGTTKSSQVGTSWSPTPPGDFLYGGGGGTSRIIDEPTWQQGVVPEPISGHWGHENRAVPDVALDGDPNTGYEIGETQTHEDGSQSYSEYRIGGTSLSSPLFAAMMALADQRAGFTHGFANPALYDMAGTNAYRDIVDPNTTIAVVRNDYTDPADPTTAILSSLRTMNQTFTIHTIPGYDDVTGLGTPRGEAFLNGLK